MNSDNVDTVIRKLVRKYLLDIWLVSKIAARNTRNKTVKMTCQGIIIIVINSNSPGYMPQINRN